MSKLSCIYVLYASSKFEKIRWCSLSLFFTDLTSSSKPRILYGPISNRTRRAKKDLESPSPSRPSLLRRRWNHIMQPGSEAIINKPRANLHENRHSLRLVHELAEELQVRGKVSLTPRQLMFVFTPESHHVYPQVSDVLNSIKNPPCKSQGNITILHSSSKGKSRLAPDIRIRTSHPSKPVLCPPPPNRKKTDKEPVRYLVSSPSPPSQQTQVITSAATTTPTTPTNEAPFTPAPAVAVAVEEAVPLLVAVPVPVPVPVPVSVPVSVDVAAAVEVEVDVNVVDVFGDAGFRTSTPPNTFGGDTAVDALAARLL